jgi:excisionase family DNA binding protein
MADRERVLTVSEAAQRIRTSEATVRRWLREKKLRGVRPGGTRLGWRIPESEVERLLRADDTPKARAA